jgi:ABC-type bacteriocin/lantibiotic exporter with double-glycine peptidase domain
MPVSRAASVSYLVPGWSQPKAWACWYTSLQMVISYFRGGGLPFPRGRLTDPSEDAETRRLYQADRGISWTSTTRIARRLGFKTLAACLTPEGMADVLIQHGPVIYGGQWPGATSGHWVVITGISGNTLSINDPAAGPVTWDYETFLGSYLLEQADQPLIHAP